MSDDSLLRFLHGLRELLPLLIFLVVTPIALYASHKSRQKQVRNLRDLAAKLGLQFNDPERKDRQLPTRQAPTRPRDSMKSAEIERAITRSGLLRAIFSMAKPLEVYGKYNGFQVNLRLVRRNKKSYTEVRAWFSETLDRGLRIERAGLWNMSLAAMSLAAAKSPKIESGNQALDKAVAIRARDELQARYIAKNIQAQQTLLALFRHKGAELTDQGVAVMQDGYQTDYSKTKALLDDMTRAMQAVAASLGKS